MSANVTPVDGWYACEASPRGGMRITPVREMHMRNQHQFLEDAWDDEVDYRPLWVFPSLEAAESFRRDARKERKRRREERCAVVGDGEGKNFTTENTEGTER